MTWRLSYIALAIVLAGCESLRLTDLSRAEVWPDAAGKAIDPDGSREVVTVPMAETWVYNASAGFGPSEPVVLDDVVIVVNRRGEIHAIDRQSGKKLGVEKLGAAVNGAPALRRGVLYIPLDQGSRRVVNAWDLIGGKSAWSIKGGDAIAASVILGDDWLYTVDRGSAIRALNTANGSLVWEVPEPFRRPIKASPIVTPSGDIVAASTGGQIGRFSQKTGERVWLVEFAEPVYQTPAVSGNTIVVASSRGTVAALDGNTGSVKWSSARGSGAVKLSSPSINGGLVAVGGTDGFVQALELASGKEIWNADLSVPIIAPPLIVDDLVFVGTLDARLIALDRRSGLTVWEKELRGRVKSAMASRDGDVYVVSEPRFVYRFEPAKAQIDNSVAQAR